MNPPSAFTDFKDELERHEFQMGAEAGRLAVTLDILTDALILVGQHGVYCQSARQPGKPAMDVQIISQNILQAKELVSSVIELLRSRKREERG
jgi:hypothetical protein